MEKDFTASALSHTQVLQKMARVRCFALDLDGTFYLDNQLFPFSLAFVNHLREAKIDYIFVTNNSSLNAKDYLSKLHRMGVPVEQRQIYTSGDATIHYLAEHSRQRDIYLLGTENLHLAFREYGFQTESQKPDFVVIGFDKTLTYDKLSRACRFIRAGVPFIATHPDLNCPMPGDDMIPDCGAISAAIASATGVQPKFIGKPNKEMITGLLQRAGVANDELAIVGDRLMTDIQTGIQHNIFSILVLSGETRRSDLQCASIRPDLVVSDLSALHHLLRDVHR